MKDRLYAEDVAVMTGIDVATWRSYVSRGQAPHPDGRDIVGPNVRPYWSAEAIRQWSSGRRGRGHRSPGSIYAFRLAGEASWHGEPNALPEGEYQEGELAFNPANSTLRFAGSRLIVRYGPVDADVMIPALYVYTTIGNQRLRATQQVHDLLFGA